VNKFDANDYSFAHLTLTLLLHYRVKYSSRILAVYNSECILVAYVQSQNIIARPQNHWKSAVTRVECASESILPRSRTLTNWNDVLTSNGPLCVTRSF